MMNQDAASEYARDDFRYPRWLKRILDAALKFGIEQLRARNVTATTLGRTRLIFMVAGVLFLLLGLYLWSGLGIAIWLYLDMCRLQLFGDRSSEAQRMRHLYDELVFAAALMLHMWLEGHFFTGLAALLGMTGMYLLTALRIKHDLDALRLPNLYFLRWDRTGFFFLFIVLGAWPGTRSYLWPVLGAWFLPVLTYYDYLWIMIQLMKRKR